MAKPPNVTYLESWKATISARREIRRLLIQTGGVPTDPAKKPSEKNPLALDSPEQAGHSEPQDPNESP